jgi:hypothetical protein
VKYQAEYNIKGQIGGEQSLKRFLTHSPPTWQEPERCFVGCN